MFDGGEACESSGYALGWCPDGYEAVTVANFPWQCRVYQGAPRCASGEAWDAGLDGCVNLATREYVGGPIIPHTEPVDCSLESDWVSCTYPECPSNDCDCALDSCRGLIPELQSACADQMEGYASSRCKGAIVDSRYPQYPDGSVLETTCINFDDFEPDPDKTFIGGNSAKGIACYVDTTEYNQCLSAWLNGQASASGPLELYVPSVEANVTLDLNDGLLAGCQELGTWLTGRCEDVEYAGCREASP